MTAKQIMQELLKHCHQVVISPVPAGKLIIYRYGLVFRVFYDCPEGLIEMHQDWISRWRPQLIQISERAAAIVSRHGIQVGNHRTPFDEIFKQYL